MLQDHRPQGACYGMNCPLCQGATAVYESRVVPDGKRRRRQCSQCKHRFTTMEVMHDEMQRYDAMLRKLTTTLHMLEFVRDNCGIAITQLQKMNEELEP
jgi:hypothetical protein